MGSFVSEGECRFWSADFHPRSFGHLRRCMVVCKTSPSAAWQQCAFTIAYGLNCILCFPVPGMIMSVNDKGAKKTFPRLKAKAHETKITIYALESVWKARMNCNDHVHQWVKLGLENSRRMEDLLAMEDGVHPWRLPADKAEELLNCTRNYYMCNLALEKYFREQKGQCLFKYGTFKHHWLLHLVKMAKFIHPAHTHCYSGESFMHVMKVLMQTCLKGRSSISSLRHFLQRYTRALSFEVSSKTWKLK